MSRYTGISFPLSNCELSLVVFKIPPRIQSGTMLSLAVKKEKKILTSELESLRVFVEIFAAHAKSSDVIISSSLPSRAESMTMQQQI